MTRPGGRASGASATVTPSAAGCRAGSRSLAGGGWVFVISGPSGGGKTTVVERLRCVMPRLLRSVSVTTRSPRPGERQGRDYRFISPRAFDQMRRTGQLLEWARVHGAYYGTPKRSVMRRLAQGRSIVMSIDVQGARKIRRALNGQAVLVFLRPPSLKTLRERLLRRRTESPASIRVRLAAAKRELACASWYDFTVMNDDVHHAVRQLTMIVERVNAGKGGT